MGSKIGRNAPCPCGSGKKYKKCCLVAHEAAAAAASSANAAPSGHGGSQKDWVIEHNDLDDLSNRVLDLIREERLDEADKACAQLRKDYPEVIDGLWRQAMVDQARGNNREAARHYRETAALARATDAFEEEGIQEWLDTADRLDPHHNT